MTVALAVSPVNSLVFHSASIGEMSARRFKLRLLGPDEAKYDPDEDVILL